MRFPGAVCTEYPEPLWLSEDEADQELAQAFCGGCPALLECAAWLAEVKPSCGVWAGQIIGGFVNQAAPDARPGPRPKVKAPLG